MVNNKDAFAQKVETDLKLFTELFKSYIEESELPEFKKLLNSTYVNYKELLQETSVTPIPSILCLRKKKAFNTLTENEITSIIYETFRNNITKEYIKPLEENNLNGLYESDMDNIFKIVLKSSTDLDPEISRKYSIFEKVVKDSISDIILPKDSIIKMNNYASKLDPAYFEVFDRTLKDIKNDFNDSVDKLTKNIAIRMFKKGIQFGKEYNKEEFNLDKYKGLSSIFKTEDLLDETLSKIPEKVKEEHQDDDLDDDELDAIINK